MQTLSYLSFLSPAASAGNLTIQIDTLDATPAASIVLNVSGITGTETENQLCFKTYTQLRTYLTQTNNIITNPSSYNNIIILPPVLTYPDQLTRPLFNVTFTDHCLCIMSQCDFDVSIPTNTVSNYIDNDVSPVPMTLAEAKTLAPALSTSFTDDNGNPLTDPQIITRLKISSSEMLSFLRNNIVSSTYIYYEITMGTKSVFVPKRPIIDFFSPTVRRPVIYTTQMMTNNTTVKSNFSCDKNRGEISFRFAQDFVNVIEPFEDNNEVMILYIAGYKKIPLIIKSSIIRFMSFLSDNDEFNQMQGENFGYKTNTRDLILRNQFAATLAAYFNG